MKLVGFILITLILLLTTTGCSMKGHEFKPNFNSINDLKDNNLKAMSIQNGNIKNEKDETIGLRAVNMTSPYGGSFSKYLEKSLEEQLKQASIYDKQSNIKISAILLKNDVSISSFSIGEADLTANFIVMNKDRKIYEEEHTIHHEWESSFLGQIAIENALENYPIAMQKLIDSFLLDKDLIEVVK
ncbi:hypothetical protein [Sulfurimonas sp.]|uniref:hypothetical protein n=1 Tax=Sulfurimonas sp. TaxID=2022749 RepID=UPI002AB2E634|nr:hypothetical protein [Sulfurimonas sp.]